ncbi:hypothetical protein ACYPKM_01190 [Pseudomonas aeruginosa]
MIFLDYETAGEVYQILVEECGAKPSDGPAFQFAYATADGKPPSEFRFQGSLGFGGKYRHPEMRVNCYPEDANDARREAIRRANERLALLRGNYLASGRFVNSNGKA